MRSAATGSEAAGTPSVRRDAGETYSRRAWHPNRSDMTLAPQAATRHLCTVDVSPVLNAATAARKEGSEKTSHFRDSPALALAIVDQRLAAARPHDRGGILPGDTRTNDSSPASQVGRSPDGCRRMKPGVGGYPTDMADE